MRYLSDLSTFVIVLWASDSLRVLPADLSTDFNDSVLPLSFSALTLLNGIFAKFSEFEIFFFYFFKVAKL